MARRRAPRPGPVTEPAALPPTDAELPEAGPFASEIGRYLLDAIEIDPHDYGTKQPGWPKPKFRITTARLNAWTAGDAPEPYSLTEKQFQAMCDGRQRLYYRPRAGAKWVLLMVDIDAHHGEKDAPKLAKWIIKRYFPGAYWEARDRGAHIYALIDIGDMPAADFNALLTKSERAIQALATANKFQAKVELKRNFALRDAQGLITDGGRGHTAAVPSFPRGWRDYNRLISSLPHPAKALRTIVADAKSLQPKRVAPRTPNSPVNPLSPTYIYLPKVDLAEPDAFKRMLQVGLELEHQTGQPPTQSDLLSSYARYFGTDETKDRRGRARDVARYLARTYDYSKLSKPRRCAAELDDIRRLVRERITDDIYNTKREPSPGRKAKHDDYRNLRGTIHEDVFVVIVFAVAQNSFKRQRRPDRQWTNGNAMFLRLFKRLKAAGLITCGIPNVTRIAAAKRMAAAVGLIECFDSSWRHAGSDEGITKKYHIGPRHPDYAEFCRWAEDNDIQTVKIRDLPDDEKSPQQEKRESLIHWVPKLFFPEKTASLNRDVDSLEPAVASATGAGIRGAPE